MMDGVARVIEGTRSAVGLVEAAVKLAVESAAVKWCAFLVADGAENDWQVVHGGGSGAPAIGTRLSPEDLAALDLSDPETALYFRPASSDPAAARRAGVIFARPHQTEPGPHEDPLHDALAGLFGHVHALLDHLPGHGLHVPGLVSPAQIRARLDEELARAKRYGGTLSLLLIDVDETGTPELEAEAHSGGNVVRREVQRVIAETLIANLRQMDSTGRHGEDGFLVLLPETGAEESLSAGDRFGRLIGQAVESHVASLDARGGEVPAFELRCGVTTFPVAAQTAPDLLVQVGEALRWTRTAPENGWLRHALPHLNVGRNGRGFRCVCRRCGKVFEVDDRAHQRARRFCSHGCYVSDRRESEHDRDTSIRAARESGASLRELARRYSLSAERVRQICQVPQVAAPV